jgi:hypothetical protein
VDECEPLLTTLFRTIITAADAYAIATAGTGIIRISSAFSYANHTMHAARHCCSESALSPPRASDLHSIPFELHLSIAKSQNLLGSSASDYAVDFRNKIAGSLVSKATE